MFSSRSWLEQARAINNAFAAREAAWAAELQAAREAAQHAQHQLAQRLAEWALESERHQAERADRIQLTTQTQAFEQEVTRLTQRLAECERAQQTQLQDHRKETFLLLESAAAVKAERDRLLAELGVVREEAALREMRSLQTSAELLKGLASEHRQTIESIGKSEMERERTRQESARAVEAELRQELTRLHQSRSALIVACDQLETQLKAAHRSWFRAFRRPRTAGVGEFCSPVAENRFSYFEPTPRTHPAVGIEKATNDLQNAAKSQGGADDAAPTQAARRDCHAIDQDLKFLLPDSGQQVPPPYQHSSSAAASSGSERAMQNSQQAAEKLRQTLVSTLNRDTEDFLQHAYRLLLGREYDPAGKAHFMESMYRGASKLQVMNDITHSSEGGGKSVFSDYIGKAYRLERLRRIPFIGLLVATFARRRLLHYPSVAECVLRLHGNSFVEQAYAHILRRSPDSEGLNNSLQSLYNGTSKFDIIDGMLRSSEYKERAFENREFRRLVKRQWVARIPLIQGSLVALLGLESRTKQSTSFRAIIETQYLLINRLEQQDEKLNIIYRQLSIATQRAIVEDNKNYSAAMIQSTADRSDYRDDHYQSLVLKMKQALSAH